MSDIIKSKIKLEKTQKKYQSSFREIIKKVIEDFKLGYSDDFETLIDYLFQSNILMQLKLLELESDLGDFKKEFSSRELTSQKFQDLLMSDDDIEE